MDLSAPYAEMAAAVAAATTLAPQGARTQWEAGNPVAPHAAPVAAPTGMLRHDPGDLTATVRAGTTVAELTAALGEHGQFVPLDPADDAATVGGVLATGLSGLRRLRYGPVRDTVLGMRFITADGRVVRAGGPTVKNVTGYDLPRLLVGSMGTLGLVVEVTLRCRPRPPQGEWFATDDRAWMAAARHALHAPSTLAYDGATLHVLLEGSDAEVRAQVTGTPLVPAGGPGRPGGAHAGRISVPSEHTMTVVDAVVALGVTCLGELGVGTVHVAAPEPGPIEQARAVAHRHGGWLLRERGAPGLDGFGTALANLAVLRRVKDAFDPDHKLSPGRLPL